MKGGIAAAMIAIEAILQEKALSRGSIELSGTVDEESGGFGGVGYLARQGYFNRDRVDHVIIPEPLNPDRVCLGHRGVWWAEIEMRGQIGHGAMPFLGVSAIRGMGHSCGCWRMNCFPPSAPASPACPACRPGRGMPR